MDAATARQQKAEHRTRAVEQSTLQNNDAMTDAIRSYAQAALRDELETLVNTTEGDRNNQLFKSSAALGELVGAGALDEQEVEDQLRDRALTIGLNNHEIEATLRNGLKTGKNNPRDLSKIELIGSAPRLTSKI